MKRRQLGDFDAYGESHENPILAGPSVLVCFGVALGRKITLWWSGTGSRRTCAGSGEHVAAHFCE
jgi:hypothetical protein